MFPMKVSYMRYGVYRSNAVTSPKSHVENLRLSFCSGVDELFVVFLDGSGARAGRAKHVVSDAMHGGC